MKTQLKVLAFSVLAVLATSAGADGDDDRERVKRSFRAQLNGLSEVASVSTTGRGSFRAQLNAAGDALTYSLSYSGLENNASQSHIHIGQHHTNGGISVWLCESAAIPAPAALQDATPTCADRATATPITGTITAASVIGPAGQGVAAAEFAELLALLRSGAAYVNVHTGRQANTTTGVTALPGIPGGEIRGQIH